jgi:hypothetical protein
MPHTMSTGVFASFALSRHGSVTLQRLSPQERLGTPYPQPYPDKLWSFA